jgi:acetyltransferase-like isoleucine patch superfamily enzyme
MVKFRTLTSEEFSNIDKDPETIYFISDVMQIYKGNVLYTSSNPENIIVTDNLFKAIKDNQAVVGIAKNLSIESSGSSTLNEDFTSTLNTEYNIKGYSKAIIEIGSNFILNNKKTVFTNMEFEINNDWVITKNTEFIDCIFTNTAPIKENLDVGCYLKFSNCIFNSDSTVLEFEKTIATGTRKIDINNCVFNNSTIEIDSQNPDKYIIIDYASNLNLDITEGNKSKVYERKNVTFDTIEIVGE